jgi:di/tricarboxylate transporter
VLETDPEGGRRTSAFLTLTALHSNIVTSTTFPTAIATNSLAAQFAANQDHDHVEPVGVRCGRARIDQPGGQSRC